MERLLARLRKNHSWTKDCTDEEILKLSKGTFCRACAKFYLEFEDLLNDIKSCF